LELFDVKITKKDEFIEFLEFSVARSFPWNCRHIPNFEGLQQAKRTESLREVDMFQGNIQLVAIAWVAVVLDWVLATSSSSLGFWPNLFSKQWHLRRCRSSVNVVKGPGQKYFYSSFMHPLSAFFCWHFYICLW